MKRIAALAIAVTFLSLPAAAQTKGKSGSAPGIAGTTPGQTQTAPGGAKDLAPGRSDLPPPGKAQSQTENPVPQKKTTK